MLMGKILQRIAFTLIALVLLSSASSSAQAQVACGTWVSKVDDRVPLLMVDPAFTWGAGPDCGATFYIENSTNVFGSFLGSSFEEAGFAMDLKAFDVNKGYQWLPPIGHVDPQSSVLFPDAKNVIRVKPYRPDQTATVTIQGVPNAYALNYDLLFFTIDAALSLSSDSKCISIPKTGLRKNWARVAKNAFPSLSQSIPGLLKGMPELEGRLAAGVSESDVYARQEDFAAFAGVFYQQAKETFRAAGLDLISNCLDAAAKKLLERSLFTQLMAAKTALTIEWDFLNWWAPLMGTYVIYYGGQDPVVTFEYTPLKVQPPSPVVMPSSPVPLLPPTPCVPPPTLFDPPDGRAFSAKSTILRWKDYVLQPGDHFEVQVWPDGGGVKNLGGEVQYKNGEWSLNINDLYAWSLGKYFWRVRVKASGGTYRSCEGNPSSFTLILKESPEPPSPSSSPPSQSSSSSSWTSSSSWSSWSH